MRHTFRLAALELGNLENEALRLILLRQEGAPRDERKKVRDNFEEGARRFEALASELPEHLEPPPGVNAKQWVMQTVDDISNLRGVLWHCSQSECDTDATLEGNARVARDRLVARCAWLRAQRIVAPPPSYKPISGELKPAGKATADNGKLPEPLGFLGGASLANALGVPELHQNAFFQRLQRSRSKLGDENWQEVTKPRPNAPRFLYKADAQAVRDIAARYTR